MAQRPQFSRILVPLDFWPASREVIDAAKSVRAGDQYLELPPNTEQLFDLLNEIGAGCEVRLMHATPSLTYTTVYGGPEGSWMPTDAMTDLEDRARKSSLAVLQDLARRFCSELNTDFAAAPGPATKVILDEARAFEADLIVLGTSGRGRVKRVVLGSTADKVIRQAQCPVLVVPIGHEH